MVATGLLSACYLPNMDMKRQTIARLGVPTGMMERQIHADPYVLTSFERVRLKHGVATVYIEGGQTAITDAVYLAVENIDEYEKSSKVKDVKRRALILVSDGEDRNSFYNEKQLFELLRESEVQIYVIGFVDDLSKEGGFISKSPQAKAKAFLERIATESGGKAYFPASIAALPDLAREISNELRTQYSIGYIPSNDRRDGTFRSIKVSVDDGLNSQKRIAVTRAGRTAEGASSKPASKPAVVTKTP